MIWASPAKTRLALAAEFDPHTTGHKFCGSVETLSLSVISNGSILLSPKLRYRNTDEKVKGHPDTHTATVLQGDALLTVDASYRRGISILVET